MCATTLSSSAPAASCRRSSCGMLASRWRPSMAPPEAALRAVALCAVLLAVATPPHAASAPQTDPLEAVKTAIRLKNFSAADTELQQLAAGGNAEAQYLLGAFYLNGLAEPRNPTLARVWLERAADKGNARAAYSLAELLSEADPVDSQGAAHWRARAQQLGFDATRATGAAASAVPAAPQLTDPAVRREALWHAAETSDLASLETLAS